MRDGRSAGSRTQEEPAGLGRHRVASGAGRPAGDVTVRALWDWLTCESVSADLLDWAPDVAALTTVLLERSQAFRFVVSPPAGATWPPARGGAFADVVTAAATEWCAMMDRGAGGAPDLVRLLWATVTDHLGVPVTDMAAGRPWPLCEAVLLLHAIADEAAAGSAGGPSAAGGSTHLARAQEMLVTTGSMARLPADRVALLPKTRTTPVGMTHRSLSRYSCTTTTGIPAAWHRVPVRRPGPEPASRHANILLLPWPLRIRETDFVPVPGSVQRPEREPFGFFEYAPSEPLDLDLVDRLLAAAVDEVDQVDVVALPEGCVHESEVAGLQAVLARHRVPLLLAGVRLDAAAPDQLPGNGVHVGVLLGEQWWHYRQRKHHRWFLDAGQVQQYNLAGALHPGVRWWEAMELPQRSVGIVELGGGLTVAAVVCEDLARLDGVAELLRAVGPTLVVTLLLDGPQLASRWTARYAAVLADDPGSAVLTLTAYGMAARSRPHGLPPSGVVAMWKDPQRGLQEIALEDGAQGVLLKAVHGLSPRYAADGRAPVDDATDLYVAGLHQLRAGPPSPAAPGALEPPAADAEPLAIDTGQLGVLSSWAEAVARALVADDDARLTQVLAAAGPGARWRTAMGVPEPDDRLAAALAALDRLGWAVLRHHRKQPGGGLPAALATLPPVVDDGADVGTASRLVRRVLRSALDAAMQP